MTDSVDADMTVRQLRGWRRAHSDEINGCSEAWVIGGCALREARGSVTNHATHIRQRWRWRATWFVSATDVLDNGFRQRWFNTRAEAMLAVEQGLGIAEPAEADGQRTSGTS